MDGVLADFGSTLHQLFPHIESMPDGKEKGDEVDRCCGEKPEIFSMLQPIKDAEKSFKWLCDHYEVYFLSTPMWLVPQSYTDKRLWVERIFGELAKKKLILTHNKGLLMGDYIIDDRIKHGVDNFRGEHIHFGQEGFEHWEDVIRYLASKDNLPVDLV